MVYNISLISSNINRIDVNLSPGVSALTPGDFTLILNNNPFTSFTLLQNNISGTSYSIVSNSSFSIYDELSISLNDTLYSSNLLKIYMSKSMYKNNSIFVYKLPEYHSGNYDFKIIQINGVIFDINLLEKLTICDGINSDTCSIVSDKTIYEQDETITLTISLTDKNNLTVPDGKYIIKTEIE